MPDRFHKRIPMLHAASAAACLCCAALLSACAGGEDGDSKRSESTADRNAPDSTALSEKSAAMDATTTLSITSTAFEPNQPIPAEFTCDDDDTSPPLKWDRGPEGTVSYAIIVDDPDAPAGTWVHWLAWNITDTELPAGRSKQALVETVVGGMMQGLNSFRKPGYGGPCPPPGKPHRYYFRLYALDTKLDLAGGASRDELEQAMDGHLLADGELMGTYARNR